MTAGTSRTMKSSIIPLCRRVPGAFIGWDKKERQGVDGGRFVARGSPGPDAPEPLASGGGWYRDAQEGLLEC